MISNMICAVIVALFFIAVPTAALAAGASFVYELEAIEKGKVEPRIPAADYRVAVFAYEDPDGTGLGTSLAALVANHVLVASEVRSLGVIHYRGSLAPSQESKLSYFNKVEKVIEAQKVSLAIWGIVRSVGPNLVIDTYLQVPQRVTSDLLTWEFTFRHTKTASYMGDTVTEKVTLVAHLRPNRIHVQHLIISQEYSQLLMQAGQRLSELRKERSFASESISLPIDQDYRMISREDDWAEFETSSGQKGWIPITAHCPNQCRLLLDSAAFAGEMLRYLSHHKSSQPALPPKSRDGLMEDTIAIEDQIKALDYIAISKGRKELAKMFVGLEGWVRPDREGGTPPGGAAFANIFAIGKVLNEVLEKYGKSEGVGWLESLLDGLFSRNAGPRLSPNTISNIAFDLAQASLYDPQNVDVLHNLAVLFRLAEDRERSRLAEDLLRQAIATLQDTQQS